VSASRKGSGSYTGIGDWGSRIRYDVGMALLSEQDRQIVREHLSGVAHDVTLLLFTQTIGGPETGLIARQILDELSTLSDRLKVEEANYVLEKDRAAKYGIDKIPAIVVLRDGEDTRMRFYGAPAGYEFMSLVEAVILAGGEESELSAESKQLIAAAEGPINIEVFVTPT
jgi:alkyl hydroperoxide reductase subunit AhpF